VAALRERPGRDVNIIAVDLVDELSLMIEPILLAGEGICPDDGAARAFERRRRRFRLADRPQPQLGSGADLGVCTESRGHNAGRGGIAFGAFHSQPVSDAA
jgi:hypothetical protein